MEIKIPVLNNIEVIIAEVYIKVEIKLREQRPIQTNEGKIAFEGIQVRLSNLSYKVANDILNELETKDGK